MSRPTSGCTPRIGSREEGLSTTLPSSSSDQPEPRCTAGQNQRERDDLFADHFLCVLRRGCRAATALPLITTTLGLIRFGGHLSDGGYDVHDGRHEAERNPTQLH